MNKLNDEQQSVKQKILAMRGGDRLIVSGRAGSGKTYAIANSVASRNALFLAPTHNARSVLDKELPANRHKVSTIHSAIGWHQYRNESLEFVDAYLPAKEARSRLKSTIENELNWFSGVDIIIVDEFSMVGSFLFGAIEEYAEEFDLPVVYGGDRFQLPPVKDREVIMDQGFQVMTLSESLRFAPDSEIFRLGELFREYIEMRPKDKLPVILGKMEVQVSSGSDWLSGIKSAYERGDNLLAVTS